MSQGFLRRTEGRNQQFFQHFSFLKLNISKLKFALWSHFLSFTVFCLRENYVRSWAFPAFAASSLRAQKLNQQPAVTYDMGNIEKAIDNKRPRELFKGYCLPYLSQMFIRRLNIHDKHQSLCFFIIWPCLTRTGNYRIHKFDWLKSILKAV